MSELPAPHTWKAPQDHGMRNAAYAELTEQGYLPTSKTDRMAVVDIVVDAIEPLIRVDEQRQYDSHNWKHLSLEANSRAVALMQERDDLRAKVEALRDKWQRSVNRDPDGKLSGYDRAHVAALGDVLALMDEGGSDA